MADFKQLLDETKRIASESDDHKDGMSKKRATFSGIVIGGIVGLMVGYSKKWNLIYSIVGGAAIGGVISRVLSPRD